MLLCVSVCRSVVSNVGSSIDMKLLLMFNHLPEHLTTMKMLKLLHFRPKAQLRKIVQSMYIVQDVFDIDNKEARKADQKHR